MMLKVIIFLAYFVTVTNASKASGNLDIRWEAFKEEQGKNYENEVEELYRRMVWERNLDYITKHNKEADLGKHSYWLGLNWLADMTNEEYRAKLLGLRMDFKSEDEFLDFNLTKAQSLPSHVDWRKKGYVTSVKNQGQCGSCWSFSATGSMEGQHFKATGNLISLSEQNLVDCSGKDGNMGCNGGLMDQAFQYVIENKGIDTEQSYPYEAENDNCRFRRKNVGATISSFRDVPSGNESALAASVATIGPISVAIDASHISFQLYKHGVYDEKRCSKFQLDHGVLTVGYGSVAGKNYWIVKNSEVNYMKFQFSWGPRWGMAGYLWMSKDKDNQCGIATSASYPIV